MIILFILFQNQIHTYEKQKCKWNLENPRRLD